MRVDRFLTLYFCGPLIRAVQRNTEFRIPILMYHSISDTKENGVHPYYQINTAPQIFGEQMLFLHENDYSVISLAEAVKLLSNDNSVTKPTTQPFNHSTTQRKLVVLTFDDGYRDFFTDAFPVLKKHGFTATVFLPTAFIDKTEPGLKGKDHLSWSEIRELQAEGFTFGSHTVHHPQLIDLRLDQVEYEIRKSKVTIEEKTHKLVEFFCYPYKFPLQDRRFIGLLRSMLHSTGYKACTTTRIGCANHSDKGFFLPRLPVNADDDARFLRAKIQGRYDWLSCIQTLVKKTRRVEMGKQKIEDR